MKVKIKQKVEKIIVQLTKKEINQMLNGKIIVKDKIEIGLEVERI